jgi:hypothetical protein
MAKSLISTAAAAIAAGYTKAVFASSSEVDFNLFVKPDADLDGAFEAWTSWPRAARGGRVTWRLA